VYLLSHGKMKIALLLLAGFLAACSNNNSDKEAIDCGASELFDSTTNPLPDELLWKTLPLPELNGGEVIGAEGHPDNQSFFYLSIADQHYYTYDTGRNWLELPVALFHEDGSEAKPSFAGYINVHIDPVKTGAFYAELCNPIGNGGIFYSETEGASWSKILGGLCPDLRFHPKDPTNLYVHDGYLGRSNFEYFSPDHGDNWHYLVGGIYQYDQVYISNADLNFFYSSDREEFRLHTFEDRALGTIATVETIEFPVADDENETLFISGFGASDGYFYMTGGKQFYRKAPACSWETFSGPTDKKSDTFLITEAPEKNWLLLQSESGIWISNDHGSTWKAGYVGDFNLSNFSLNGNILVVVTNNEVLYTEL
jgi:hypothetical protein